MVQILGLFLVFATISFSQSSLAQAEIWDLGYSNSSPEVEEIPDSITGDTKAEISEVKEVEPVRSSNSVLKISTKQNTYGVDTVENTGLKLFLSPIAGLTSIMGNATVDVSPQYSYGGRVGLLMSDQIMIEGGYTYSLINTSTPVNAIIGTTATDVYALKQNAFDVGAKIFFLGRESRFRPFIGGGIALSRAALNYTSTYSNMMGLSDDYQMKQFQGVGQLGAELAITRGVVATAAFKFNGVFSSSVQSIKNASSATGLEASRIQAGESLSRSASYSGSVGVGVYF